MGNKERQAEMDTRQEKEKALWRQLEQTDTAKETQLKHNEEEKGNHVTTRHLPGDLLYRTCRDTKPGFYSLRPLTISWLQQFHSSATLMTSFPLGHQLKRSEFRVKTGTAVVRTHD